MASFTWNGFARLMDGLDGLAHPDPTPLMVEWELTIVEDNRRGVLAGTDKDGNPMKPVTYRPVGAPSTQRVKKHQRNGAESKARGVFAGLGPHAAGQHNNLTSREYRFLGGPPLAPRGASSRVITNLFTQHGRDGDEWFAEGAWFEVVSTRGIPFLLAHFIGANTGRGGKVKLPVRDLRGVRPWGQQRAQTALRKWGASLLKAIG